MSRSSWAWPARRRAGSSCCWRDWPPWWPAPLRWPSANTCRWPRRWSCSGACWPTTASTSGAPPSRLARRSRSSSAAAECSGPPRTMPRSRSRWSRTARSPSTRDRWASTPTSWARPGRRPSPRCSPSPAARWCPWSPGSSGPAPRRRSAPSRWAPRRPSPWEGCSATWAGATWPGAPRASCWRLPSRPPPPGARVGCSTSPSPERSGLGDAEPPARLRGLEQRRRRREPGAEPALVGAQPLDHARRAERVRVPEGTAAERGPAQAEHRADVAIAGGAEDPLSQAMRGLVDHLQRAALGDLGSGRRAALLPLSGQVVDGAVHFLAPRVAVQIEALLRLPPQPAALHQLLEPRRRRQPGAERLVHDVRDFRSDVDPHLVEELHRSDREPELDQRPIDVLDRGPFVEEERSLVRVRREDARGVEAGTVVDHDHGLADLLPQRDRRRHRLRARAPPADDLQQRHPLDRREEVHPHHLVGALGAFGDEADRDRRGVRGEDRVGRLALQVAQHRLLYGKILEHRLDHHVGGLHPAVVRGARDQRQPLLALPERKALALDGLVEKRGDLLEPAPERRIVLVLDPRRNAGFRRHVGDASAHQPRAQDPHLLHLPRLYRGIVDAGVLLQRLRSEEDLYQPPRDVAYHQLAEERRLRAIALVGTLLHADPDRLQRPLRRRVVAMRLAQQRLAGLLEEDPAAHRVVLQRELLQDVAAQQPGQGQLHLPALDAQLAGGQLARPPPRDVEQDGQGNHLVHQPELARLLGAHRLAGQDQVERLRDSDQLRQP